MEVLLPDPVAIYLIPAVAAACMAGMAALAFLHSPAEGRNMIALKFVCFAAGAVRFSLLALNVHRPGEFPMLNWLTYLVALGFWLLLYRVFFEQTKVDPRERFPVQSYAAAIVPPLALLIATAPVPVEMQAQATRNLFITSTDFPVFAMLTNTKETVLTLVALWVAYSILTRLKRLRGVHEDDRAAGRLKAYAVLMALPPLFTLACAISRWASGYPLQLFLNASALSFSVLMLYLGYNMLTQAHPVVRLTAADGDQQAGNNADELLAPALTREYIDQYMRTRKPHLDPNANIIELAKDMGFNRTYISGFINREFGVNFRSFLNTYRLEEFEALSELRPELSRHERASMAGFGSYDSYVRCCQKVGQN